MILAHMSDGTLCSLPGALIGAALHEWRKKEKQESGGNEDEEGSMAMGSGEKIDDKREEERIGGAEMLARRFEALCIRQVCQLSYMMTSVSLQLEERREGSDGSEGGWMKA